MSTLIVSSKGQIVLPAEMRRRLGLGAGAKLEAIEETDGVRLRLIRSIRESEVTALAGMVKLRPGGKPRRPDDFDAASLLRQAGKRKR